MKLNIVCGLSAVAVLALTGCNRGGSSSGSIAVVGHDQVTEKEFFDYLQRKKDFIAIVQGRPAAVQLSNPPGYQALQDLVLQKIVKQIAKEQNVFPTDAQVNAELQMNLKQNPHLVDTALGAGYSMDELKEEIRVQLCRLNIQTKGVTVSPTEIDDFIKKNPKRFEDAPQVQAMMILVKNKKDEKAVDDALKSGQPFATVAQTYTLDRNGAKTGFHYPVTNEAQMAAGVRALFDKTDELKTTDWQALGKKDDTGFVKFYMEKKVPAKPIEITDFIRENVKRALMTDKGAAAGINLDKLIADKVQADKDSIKITPKQDADIWKSFTVKVGEELAAQKNNPASAIQTPPGTPAGAASSAPPAGTTPTAPAAGAPDQKAAAKK